MRIVIEADAHTEQALERIMSAYGLLTKTSAVKIAINYMAKTDDVVISSNPK